VVRLFRKTALTIIFFVLIVTFHGIVATQETSLQDSNGPAYLNFFRYVLLSRNRVLLRAKDWIKCYVQQFCKETMRDMIHCTGECGRACAYSLVCYDGKCVDIQNDPRHCGSCFEECPEQSRCSYAMCDHGG
ncbi:hypothetical protein I3843_02G069000, partial [Carya illinoinensis]